MVDNFHIADSDPDDPVIWQRGAMSPDGRVLVMIVRQSNKDRLVGAFGLEWFEAHLLEKEAEVAGWGVQ